jgi:tripartite-type tricarboxylate transporter receptor subunit TctC
MRSARLVVSGLVCSTALLCAGSAFSQNYPVRVVRILASEAGGTADMISRIIAQGISPNLGQPVIVENHGGGVISPELVAKAPPDGYTLLSYGNTFWLMPLMRSKMSYDPQKDFVPVTVAVKTPLVLLVHPSMPVKTVKDLIALAKAKPKDLNYSSAAIGTSSHLGTEMFKFLAHVNMVRIGYKGHASALNALVSGDTHLMFANVGPAMVQANSGRVRAIAVSSPQPSPLAPGLPTLAASGVPGYDAMQLSGLFAPAKTPDAIISRLNREIAQVMTRSDVKEKLFNAGLEPLAGSSDESAALIRSEVARYAKVVKAAGIRDE